MRELKELVELVCVIGLEEFQEDFNELIFIERIVGLRGCEEFFVVRVAKPAVFEWNAVIHAREAVLRFVVGFCDWEIPAIHSDFVRKSAECCFAESVVKVISDVRCA